MSVKTIDGPRMSCMCAPFIPLVHCAVLHTCWGRSSGWSARGCRGAARARRAVVVGVVVVTAGMRVAGGGECCVCVCVLQVGALS